MNEATSLHSTSLASEPEFQTLIEALERNGDRSLTDLVGAIDKAWPKPKVKAPPKRKLPRVAAIDPSQWLSKLREARGDSGTFEQLLAELAKSKQLKLPDVAAVANGFRSTNKSYRSKQLAIDDIRRAWIEERRDYEKLQSAKGIF